MKTDIDDRKRAEALLAGEKRLLEMVAGGRSMSEILEALCRLVEARSRAGATAASYWSIRAVRVSNTERHRAFRPDSSTR